MANPDTQLKLTDDDIQSLKLIRAHIAQAQVEFNKFPRALQNEINDFHNEDGSIGHCLRWGETACEELVAHCIKPQNKITVSAAPARPRARP